MKMILKWSIFIVPMLLLALAAAAEDSAVAARASAERRAAVTSARRAWSLLCMGGGRGARDGVNTVQRRAREECEASTHPGQ